MNLIDYLSDPTWDIVDSSKLDCFMRCRRRFFYEYILGWKLDVPAHDLHFGNCWHLAREHQLLNGYSDVDGAYEAFLTEYRKVFDEETDETFMPKDPWGAFLALNKFAQSPDRANDLVDNELLYTEVSGTVPINHSGRVLHYRMDTVMRNKAEDYFFSWDHKSTKNVNSDYWTDQFQLSIQNGTYTHCLYCLHPIDKVRGMIFCGTGFRYLKRGSKINPQGYNIDLKRVVAFKEPDQMNQWLWSVNWLYDEYERELQSLANSREDDPVLMAFPLSTNSCKDFRGCLWYDNCLSWANPLQHCKQPPYGYKVEFWDPSKMETTNKKDLEWR